VVYLQRQEPQKGRQSIGVLSCNSEKLNGSDEEGLERDLFTYLEFIKRNACCASSNIDW
jgi:hypothetical protein